MRHEPASWFILAGALFYGIASTQGTVQAFRAANLLLHFTNYTIGHAHFAAYGFVSLLLFGAIYNLVPHLTGQACSPALVRAHFWLALTGLVVYVIAMTIGGVMQGLSWAAGAPFIDSVVIEQPWLRLRATGGSLMAASHVLFAWNLWQMRPRSAPEPHFQPQGALA